VIVSISSFVLLRIDKPLTDDRFIVDTHAIGSVNNMLDELMTFAGW